MITRRERQMIAEYYGVGQGNRKIRITRSGEVHYYGSCIDTDRDHDYWHYGGTVADVLRWELLRRGGFTRRRPAIDEAYELTVDRSTE